MATKIFSEDWISSSLDSEEIGERDRQVLLAGLPLRFDISRIQSAKLAYFVERLIQDVILDDLICEAICGLLRPALQFSGGRFTEPALDLWRSRLRGSTRDSLERQSRSVGQLWHKDPEKTRWRAEGTAWVCHRSGILLTTRHSALEFSTRRPNSAPIVFPGHRVVVDYSDTQECFLGNRGNHCLESNRDIYEVAPLWISDAEEDLAVLEMRDAKPRPPSLPLASSDPEPGSHLAIIGFPGAPKGPRENKVFQQPHATKKLAPGKNLAPDPGFPAWQTKTDASTLDGSSGSPVISLDSNEVVALHYHGDFPNGNCAVKISSIRKVLHSLDFRDE